MCVWRYITLMNKILHGLESQLIITIAFHISEKKHLTTRMLECVIYSLGVVMCQVRAQERIEKTKQMLFIL